MYEVVVLCVQEEFVLKLREDIRDVIFEVDVELFLKFVRVVEVLLTHGEGFDAEVHSLLTLFFNHLVQRGIHREPFLLKLFCCR